MSDNSHSEDKFLALVSAKAEVDLRLSEFAPRSMLVTPAHYPKCPSFPAIDYHNHLDSQDPTSVLTIRDPLLSSLFSVAPDSRQHPLAMQPVLTYSPSLLARASRRWAAVPSIKEDSG